MGPLHILALAVFYPPASRARPAHSGNDLGGGAMICEYGDCPAWMTNLDWFPLWIIASAILVNALVWFWVAHRGQAEFRKCAAMGFGVWPALLVIKLVTHFFAH